MDKVVRVYMEDRHACVYIAATGADWLTATLLPKPNLNQAAREALSDPRTFVKGPDYKEKFSFVFGDGLVTSVGEKHKHDRALFAKYFTQKKIETHLPVLCKQTLASIETVRSMGLHRALIGGWVGGWMGSHVPCHTHHHNHDDRRWSRTWGRW